MKKLKRRIASAFHGRFASLNQLPNGSSGSISRSVSSVDPAYCDYCVVGSAESAFGHPHYHAQSSWLGAGSNASKSYNDLSIVSYNYSADADAGDSLGSYVNSSCTLNDSHAYRKTNPADNQSQLRHAHAHDVPQNLKSKRVHSMLALQESISEVLEPIDDNAVKNGMSASAVVSSWQRRPVADGTVSEIPFNAKRVDRDFSSVSDQDRSYVKPGQPCTGRVCYSQSSCSLQAVPSHVNGGCAKKASANRNHRHFKSNAVNDAFRKQSFHGFGSAVVREHPAIGSDGESVDGSGTSDEVMSPNGRIAGSVVNVRMRNKPTRRYSEQDIQKRLSLPADLRLPLSVVEKLNRTPTLDLDQPLTRKNRRVSLSEIGFGKLESYQKLEKLGEGTYATVYRGRSRLTNNLVALKEIRLEHEEGAPCTAIREVSLLRDLRHANVVTLHDIIHTDKCLTLVFEYLERDLKHYMDECGNILSMNNVRIFLFQLLRGLAYCHARRVLHRDLKPQNLLINLKGELKLADFGLARAKSVPTKTYSNEVVTLWYRPPDVLLGSTDYSTQIDMWGVGCILYEMAAGRPFFPGSTADEQLHLIFRALGTPSLAVHTELAILPEFKEYRFPSYRAEPLVNHAPRLDIDGLDLLARFLQYEGKKRLSARDAMHHNFFSPLGPAVLKLPDTVSIFTVPGIQLSRDPGYRAAHSTSANGGFSKSRRQSMLL